MGMLPVLNKKDEYMTLQQAIVGDNLKLGEWFNLKLCLAGYGDLAVAATTEKGTILHLDRNEVITILPQWNTVQYVEQVTEILGNLPGNTLVEIEDLGVFKAILVEWGDLLYRKEKLNFRIV